MATIQYVVNAVDAASATFARIAGSADDLLHKLDEIGNKRETAWIGLKGDKEAQLTIDKLELKMAALGKKVAEGKIGVEGQARALLQIQALEASLDRLGAKDVTATVHVKVDRKGLRGLLSGAALSGLSPGGGGGGGIGGLGGLLAPAAIGGGIVGAGLVPGAVGLGLGGAAGLGAIGGGLFGAGQGQKIATQDLKDIAAITTQLKAAIGKQRKELEQSLKDAQQKYAKDVRFYSPFFAFQGAIKNLAQTVLAPLRPIMTPLAGLFTQFGKGLTALGPQFTSLFRASLPFVRQFLQFMLQAGKILLPAFTQALNEMVKSGALTQMTQALVILTRGLATFIVNLGPGMAASAKIFARLSTFIGRALGFLGDAFSAVAKFLASDWSPADLWNVLLANAKAFFGAVIGSARAFWHAVVASFNAMRHDIATVWDTIWRNTVTRVKNGIQDVVTWFRGLPSRAVSALTGLGTMLYNFGHQALTKLWNGMKNVFSSVWSWFKSLPSKLLHAIGIKSPPDWAIQAGRHIMGGLLKGIISRKDELLQRMQNLSASMGGALSGRFGPMGGGVARWAGTVRKALAMEGLPLGLTNAVLYQMMTESGGNPYAINLWDSNAAAGHPSKGLMQVIQPTFDAYHVATTSWNIYDPLANIAAAINYAAHNRGFGSGPGQIGSGHGYALGGIITEPIWGIGASGRRYSFGERGPETVTPGTGGQMSTARVEALLAQLIAVTAASAGQSGAAFAQALNSASRAAGQRAYYGAR